MNPARSVQLTGCLPSCAQTACAVAATSGAVEMVETTSTSFITCAGLKKCMPTTSAGRPLAAARWMTGRLEVVRSEEHTSELQSRQYLVCRLLLEKKKKEISHAR